MTVERVRGRVLDESGRGLEGLRVTVQEEAILSPAVVARVRTDADGAFVFKPPPESRARYFVHDRAGIRLLAESVLREIRIPRRLADGWLVTDAEGQPEPIYRGNAVEWLVDGARFFGATLDAIRRAKRRVHVMQLLLKRDLPGRFADDDPDRPELILDALVRATERGVEARILLNENAIVPDDVDEVRELMRERGGPGLAIVRGFPMSPEVLHAKATIVDDEEAIVIGPPGEPRWWDTSAHSVRDDRRGRGQPMHDVGVRLRGPMVGELGRLFATLWNSRDGAEPGPRDALAMPPDPPPAGATSLHAARTMPAGMLSRSGETTIAQAYERALANAQRFVFLETQYFTSRRIADALRAALEANPLLEAIVVLNNHMDVPLGHYDRLQGRQLAAAGWPGHPRLGVFSLAAWAPGRIRDVYVHSKVAIVDDRWATTGSANLDGYSLDSADEFGLPGVRSLEWNLVVLDGLEGEPKSGAARELRLDLWAEELGLPREAIEDAPPDGWLALWTRRARENQGALERGEAPHGFAFPHLAPAPRGVKRLTHDFNPFNRRKVQREGI